LRRLAVVTDPEIAAAWAEVHAATPTGWFVGRPGYDNTHGQWTQYAFDPKEKARVGLRTREWTCVGVTELHVLREMAKALLAISEGRVPK
jgi:hypothetical protein